MKLTKKKVTVVSLVVCLLAILSFSTLAWFNAKDEVTNTFKIADSDGDGTPDFSVEVWENETDGDNDADQDGDGDNSIAHDGVTYEDILPGDVLAKNPTVENTGDYEQWVRVYVTFDEWEVISNACAAKGISDDLRTWLDVNAGLSTPAWTPVGDGVVENNAITYVYYYNYKLTKDATATLFYNVTIPGAFEQEDMKFVNGNFTIKVKAEAIQADNTGANAYDAFAACWSEDYSN